MEVSTLLCATRTGDQGLAAASITSSASRRRTSIGSKPAWFRSRIQPDTGIPLPIRSVSRETQELSVIVDKNRIRPPPESLPVLLIVTGRLPRLLLERDSRARREPRDPRRWLTSLRQARLSRREARRAQALGRQDRAHRRLTRLV